jgi:hypothetical protein
MTGVMNAIKQRALQTLAEAKHGVAPELRCKTCGDQHCDRNFPDEMAEAWARGVIDALNSVEHHEVSQSEIDWYVEQQRQLVGDSANVRSAFNSPTGVPRT